MGSEGDKDMCWICLEEDSDDGDTTLYSPCKCPRKVHPKCLARWQLQQAGRHEEKFCRFCNTTLADWKQNLTPEELKPEVSKVQPIMVVYFEGQIHRIPVKQGSDGLSEFTTRIRELFRLPDDVDISLTFGCKEPMSGQHLKLEGMGAFDAAVHCASVAAAERQHKVKKSYSTGNLASGPATAGGSPTHLPRAASNQQLPMMPLAGGGDPPLGPSLAAPAPTSAARSAAASSPVASGPSAAADGDRRRRFQEGHRAHSHTFHVRPNSSSRSSPRAPAPDAAGQHPPRPQPPPAALRNILSLIGPATGSSNTNGSSRGTAAALGGGGGPTAAAAGGGEGGVRGGARGQAAEDLSGPQPSSFSMSHMTPPPAARLKSGRFSSRNITELTDVPEIDETVAVGSLSGKFKLHLKAFSRKVARSLSFTNKVQGSGGSSSTTTSGFQQQQQQQGMTGGGGSTSRSPALTPRGAASVTVASSVLAGSPGGIRAAPGSFTITSTPEATGPTGSSAPSPAPSGVGPMSAAAPGLNLHTAAHAGLVGGV